MPPPLIADWEPVKTTAISTGSLKIASERHNISYDAVRQQASREQWPVATRIKKNLAKAKAAAQAAIVIRQPDAVTVVTNASDAMANQLADDSKATRIGFSKAARKVAESLPNKSETDLLNKDIAKSAKHWAGVAATAQPGWEQEKKADGGLVSVALIRLELPAAEKVIQAHIVEDQ